MSQGFSLINKHYRTDHFWWEPKRNTPVCFSGCISWDLGVICGYGRPYIFSCVSGTLLSYMGSTIFSKL